MKSFTMERALAFFLVALSVATQGDIVQFKACKGSHASSNCDVSQLRINPCPEAAEKKPCKVKIEHNASIEFDFVSKANVSDLTTTAYWVSSLADLPLEGMDTVGCHYTQCPTTGSNQTLKYQLYISSYFPPKQYTVKWRLWKDNEMECCLVFRILVEKDTKKKDKGNKESKESKGNKENKEIA